MKNKDHPLNSAGAIHRPTTKLGHCGTFDVYNYGDLLYPLVLDRLLAEEYALPPCAKYGLVGGKAYPQQPFSTQPLANLYSQRRHLDALLIGGGDILRTDWDILCGHYEARMKPAIEKSVPYRVRRLLARWSGPAPSWTAHARRKLLHPEQLAPFVIHPAWLGGRTKVAYLSVGVVHDLTPFAAEVARAFDSAAMAYIRDDRSAQRLRDCRVKCPLVIAPDIAVTVGRYFDPRSAADRGRSILQAAGLRTDLPTLVFQCNPQPAAYFEQIVAALQTLHMRLGCQVACLPIGHCLGDTIPLAKIVQRSAAGVRLVDPGTVEGIMDVIAAATAFCGTSMHGSITAFSFGVPLVIGVIPLAKIDGFMQQCALPEAHRLHSWTELPDRMALVLSEDPSLRHARIAAALRAVDAAIAEVMSAIGVTLPEKAPLPNRLADAREVRCIA